jgi:hypothetical protein
VTSMILNCSEPGCLASIVILENLADGATYTCRKHTPIGENNIHFQHHQFEHDLGSGFDPKVYEERQMAKKRMIKFVHIGRPRKERLKKIEKSLVGHENAAEIMAVLRTETRRSKS